MDEGDAVKKGQMIARLDRDQLMAQREREAAGLASAKRNWRKAQPRSNGRSRRCRRYRAAEGGSDVRLSRGCWS